MTQFTCKIDCIMLKFEHRNEEMIFHKDKEKGMYLGFCSHLEEYMARKRIKLEWSLAEVLSDRGITARQFIEDAYKLDPSCTRGVLEKCVRTKKRRINLNLLGVIVSVLDCQIEDLLSHGNKKSEDIYFEGDIFSLVCRRSVDTYFTVKITEEETEAFHFLKDQRVGSAVDYVGTSVRVKTVIELLEARKTERSTYIASFFKVLKNNTLPVREERASARFMCFLRNSTAAEGYVSLVIMSTHAVTLVTKHSFVTLDLLKNYTNFSINKDQVITPWFEVEDLKRVYGFSDYSTQDLKKFVLNKSIADIKNNMGFDIQVEFQSRQNKHARFLINKA